VIILAECATPTSQVLEALNSRDASYHFANTPGCRKLAVFTRFPSEFVVPVCEGPRFTIRTIELSASSEIIIAAVHLGSRRDHSRESQGFDCAVLARTIRDAEEALGPSRTVLVGDINANPFDDGVVAAAGLNAVMTRQIASRGSRMVDSHSFPFFYNPMWGRLGDESKGPPGTHYYARSEQVEFFWHTYDQVLVRPALLDDFEGAELDVPMSIGATSLLNAGGRPDKKLASDHLPLVFSIRS